MPKYNKSKKHNKIEIIDNNELISQSTLQSTLQSTSHIVDNFKKFEFKKYCSRYSFIPFVFNKVRRIVVLGDIHGDYELAIKLLTLSKVAKIKNSSKKKSSNTYGKLDLSSEED